MKTPLNSDIFKETLHHLCEVEANWNPVAVPGIRTARKILDGEETLVLENVSSIPCLPYRELLKRLKDAGFGCDKNDEETCDEGRKAVLGLDQLPISRFSIECVIDGLAHALRFNSNEEKSRRAHTRRLAIEIRNKEPLRNNHKYKVDRAMEIFTTAMSANAKAITPYLLARRFDRLDIGEEISAGEVAGISRRNCRQYNYGCIRYQTDKLNKLPPSIELLVVCNLTWLFWHWPITAEMYPTAGRPPKKQPRGPRVPIEEKPHREITAHFLNSLFPQSNSTHSYATVKDNYSLPKGAVFCGW